MGRTEYRNVREEWDYDHPDAHGNPRRVYVESSFDNSADKRAHASNKYGIFWEDGYFQVKTEKSTGYGRMVWEDTYEEDVEVSYSWLHNNDLIKMLEKDEVIDVPVLSGEKKGSVMKLGYVYFPMTDTTGEKVRVWGLVYDGKFVFFGNRERLHGELVIPAQIKGMPISRVENFFSCPNITRLVLSEGITSIWERAFWGCSHLEEILFPKTISWLGSDCFGGCNAIKRLIIPKQIRESSYGRNWDHTFEDVIPHLEITILE